VTDQLTCAGASRDNYNQNGNQLNSFVDLVSLAGAGIDGTVFELSNGTTDIARNLLESSSAQLRLNTQVTGISKRADQYKVDWRETHDGSESSDLCDQVILATPLEFTNISLPEGADVLVDRPYQPVFATFVAGELSRTHFGRSDLDSVLTADNSTAAWTSIGRHNQMPDGSDIWKVFSTAPLTDQVVDSIFQSHTHVQRVAWNSTGAYPKLSPRVDWPKFELLPGLVYASAMESAVSCMETQIISGKNAALLVSNVEHE